MMNCGFKKVIVESDNEEIVHAFHERQNPYPLDPHVFSEIMMLSTYDWELSLSKIFREKNKVSDALIKISLGTSAHFTVLDEPSQEIIPFLTADAYGLCNLRSITV